MKALGLIRIAPLLTVGIALIGGCRDSTPIETVAEHSVVCDGRPDWCLIATNDMSLSLPIYVYIDDKMAGIVLHGKTRRFPTRAGEKHFAKFCALFNISDIANGPEPTTKEWKCSPSAEMVFDKNDLALVIYPL